MRVSRKYPYLIMANVTPNDRRWRSDWINRRRKLDAEFSRTGKSACWYLKESRVLRTSEKAMASNRKPIDKELTICSNCACVGACAAPKISCASGALRRLPTTSTSESAASSRASEYNDRWLADRCASGGHSDARTPIWELRELDCDCENEASSCVASTCDARENRRVHSIIKSMRYCERRRVSNLIEEVEVIERGMHSQQQVARRPRATNLHAVETLVER